MSPQTNSEKGSQLRIALKFLQLNFKCIAVIKRGLTQREDMNRVARLKPTVLNISTLIYFVRCFMLGLPMAKRTQVIIDDMGSKHQNRNIIWATFVLPSQQIIPWLPLFPLTRPFREIAKKQEKSWPKKMELLGWSNGLHHVQLIMRLIMQFFMITVMIDDLYCLHVLTRNPSGSTRTANPSR